MVVRRFAISYSRFSDPKQAKGDSAERQEKEFLAFCKRHNLAPLTKVYADRGRSGYKDEHRKKGELGVLIAAAKAGEIEPGTVIVVEAWDRLGRLRPDRQTELVAELLRTGVSIGVCRLNDVFTEEDFGTHKWAILSTFIMLAYQESKQKADRVASAWGKRRERAREDGTLISARLPAWLRVVDGKLTKIPERVAAVKRIFALSADGYGRSRIIAKLIAEDFPPLGTSGEWTRPYVNKILNDRRVLGELQPRHGDGKPDGAVLPKYYPRVIEDDEYNLARTGQASRRGKPKTRDRRHVNVFQSMLINAIDGGGFFLHNHGTAKQPVLILVNSNGQTGRTRTQTFPYDVFEDAILGKLTEVNPADVLPKPSAKASRADALRADLAKIRVDLEGFRADLMRGYSRHLADLLREREAQEEKAIAALQEELARTARPADGAWHSLPSLVALVRGEGADARLRLRTILRSIVDEARLLLVRRRSRILAAAQFYFVGGAVRSYLVLYQAASRHQRRGSWVRSFADASLSGKLDLRKPDHVRRLATVLEKIDLNSFTEGDQ